MKKSIIRSVLAAELVLLVPLLGMVFSDDVDWGVADFVLAGVLLAGVGLSYQLITNGMKNNARQAVIGVALAAAMVMIWMELAVGLFGTPFAGS